MFAPLVDIGAQRGLRHVTYSRPGYASSDRCAGRTVADCALDVAAIADALDIEAATIAGVAPLFAEGLDWLDGMGQENLDEVAAAEAGEEQLLGFLEPFREQIMSASGTELSAVLGDLLSEVDRSVLTGQCADYVANSERQGLARGVYGWLDDDMAFMRDWGFDVADVSRPVTVWQGAQDRMVPPGHGEWLAAHVPGARARLLPEHGHSRSRSRPTPKSSTT
jgi:pimeloyl-ACP methyl ester carboxylesterase